MRLKLKFSGISSRIVLPLHHNHIVQSMLYSNLPKKISDFLHNSGFFYHKRKYKLFTFSKIFSKKYKVDNNKISFTSPITLYISSAVQNFIASWGENFIKNEKVMLGNNEIFIQSIEVSPPPQIKEKIIIKTLSPITVYKTEIIDNKKKVTYFTPYDFEFKDLIKDNIKRKYKVLTKEDIEDFDFDIIPFGKFREVPLKYKDNYFIKAIEGKFKLKCNPYILSKVYDTGLGSKNSQGFGMVEIVENKKLKIESGKK